MVTQDDLVQHLLELDSDIVAAEQRLQAALTSDSKWQVEQQGSLTPTMPYTDDHSAMMADVERLKALREVLVQQINSIPGIEVF